MPTTFAFAPGSFVFIVILLVILAGIVYGFFTVRGSGIDQHPSDGSAQAPGAEGHSEASGRDEGDGSNLDTHGTR